MSEGYALMMRFMRPYVTPQISRATKTGLPLLTAPARKSPRIPMPEKRMINLHGRRTGEADKCEWETEGHVRDGCLVHDRDGAADEERREHHSRGGEEGAVGEHRIVEGGRRKALK